MDVAPLVDALLGLEVDALLGRDGHGLLVLQQLVVDVLAVDHRVPAPVEDEPDKVLPLCQDLKRFFCSTGSPLAGTRWCDKHFQATVQFPITSVVDSPQQH